MLRLSGQNSDNALLLDFVETKIFTVFLLSKLCRPPFAISWSSNTRNTFYLLKVFYSGLIQQILQSFRFCVRMLLNIWKDYWNSLSVRQKEIPCQVWKWCYEVNAIMFVPLFVNTGQSWWCVCWNKKLSLSINYSPQSIAVDFYYLRRFFHFHLLWWRLLKSPVN